MGLFVTFEGGEGSGKTAQARALYRRLSRLAIPVLLVHEPGGTSLGRRLRHLLKRPKNTDISPLSELLMFNASRAQLVDEVIRPNMEKGEVVICDRYADSTIAYQSYGRGLDLETVDIINRTATRGLKPDLTVLLDIAVEGGLARKRTKEHDRFEQEDAAFHRKVREGYLKLAAGEPERWLVVDGALARTEIGNIIWQGVEPLLLREGML